MITQGGNAELELVDSMDPFAEGIIFSVMPPKKSWKNISNLSGGEKVDNFPPIIGGDKLIATCRRLLALSPSSSLYTSSRQAWILISYLDALTYFPLQPTPLYFMDEIDAALDFRNVSIIANYIKDRTKNAQFIIISLRYVSPSSTHLPLTRIMLMLICRNDMFELSHRLIGIYKTANVTQSISIDNHALTARPVNTASMNSPSKST